MKKIFLLSVVCVLLGLLLGYAVAWGCFARLEQQYARWEAEPVTKEAQATQDAGKTVPGAGFPVPTPELEYGGTFDLGVVSPDEKEIRHGFELKNIGVAPLKITAGPTSCHCTATELSRAEVPPGESAFATLVLKLGNSTGPFEQSALFYTNDPNAGEISLKVTGRVDVPVWLDAPEVSVPRLAVNMPYEKTLHVYSVEKDTLEVSEIQMENEAIAKFFTITPEPIPAEQIPAGVPQAKSGVALKLRILPGMKIGAFRMPIRMKVRAAECPELTLVVHGVVGDDMALYGRGWNEEKNILTLDGIQRGLPFERTVWVLIRGKESEKASLTAESVTPDFITVKTDACLPDAEKLSSRVPVSISFPADAPACNYWSTVPEELGAVVLKNRADGKTLKIYLRFVLY